jgi:predicted XRE-type DNA-binding protein
MSKGAQMVLGNRNVFIDLGFDEDEAEELLLKSQLLNRLEYAIVDSALSKKELAKRLGASQAKLSSILKHGINELSIGQVTNYLLKLGWQVNLDISRVPHKSNPITNRKRAKTVVKASSKRKGSA